MKSLQFFRVNIECEHLNLLILLKRRLVCEFPAEKTNHVIKDRFSWTVEAENFNIRIIELMALQGDMELMGNYSANYGYLLASFWQVGMKTGEHPLIEAFRWLTVSDRIAVRIGAGADNLWSPIYWLYVRRVSCRVSWLKIIEWIKPVVRNSAPGPGLPNPTENTSCFDYILMRCMYILTSHDDYLADSYIPTAQILMLLEEMVKVKRIESIDLNFSRDAFEKICEKSKLVSRDLSDKERKKLDKIRIQLTGSNENGVKAGV